MPPKRSARRTTPAADITIGLPAPLVPQAERLGHWLVAPLPSASGSIDGIRLPQLKRWTALAIKWLYWNHPAFGTSASAVPPGTQCLLWENQDGSHGLILPVLAAEGACSLAGTEAGLALQWRDGVRTQKPQPLAFFAQGSDPFQLLSDSVAQVARRLGTFRTRDHKRRPAFFNHLGWCTWDAFYQEVDAEKVIAGLHSFQEGGCPPGFLIVDDGWQDTNPGEQLRSFQANTAKFPGGLSALAQRAKTEFNVAHFGVWHALLGYWCGIDPASPLGAQFKTLASSTNIRPWQDKAAEVAIVAPDDVYRFFQDFYRALREQGVDLVKVDGQASLAPCLVPQAPRGSGVRAYMEALQGAAFTHFQGALLHCMSNASDIGYNLLASSAWRNSDDYYPRKPLSSQQYHVHNNAFNALWSAQFSWPDWDMFQSRGPAPAFHAAARALSGGPIYLCDKPGEQDFELIAKLCIHNARTLLCDRPALPARDCLFTDTSREPVLLKLTNLSGPIGLLGVFHCQADGGPLSCTYAPSDIHDLARDERFAVFHHTSRQLGLVDWNESRSLTLGPAEFEIVTISAVQAGFAPLGLLDKFNGPAAIEMASPDGEDCWSIELADGGRFGFYAEDEPAEILLSGQPLKFRYHGASGLGEVEVPRGDRRWLDIVW